MKCFIPKCGDMGRLILRVTVAGLMLFHGVAKLMSGVDPVAGMLAGVGLPGFIAYGVYVGEVLAPLMMLVGFRTRIAAVLMAGTMVVAIGLAHMGDLMAINAFGGWAVELQMFFLLNAVAVFFLGAGKIAVSKNNSWD